MQDEEIGIKKAASILEMDQRTLKKYLNMGLIKIPYRVSNRISPQNTVYEKYRFKKTDVINYFEKNNKNN